MAAADPAFAASTDARWRAHEVQRVMREANALALASHLMWSLWGLIQAAQSNIEFDYLAYSGQRLDEYRKRRDTFLADLDAPLLDELPHVRTPSPRAAPMAVTPAPAAAGAAVAGANNSAGNGRSGRSRSKSQGRRM